MTLHTKVKGNIGEIAVAKDLMLQGFEVFTELGDLSKTDLIIQKNNTLLRVQVKFINSKKGKVTISRKKSGPDYSFLYKESDFDLMAIYNPQLDKVAYITSRDLCQNKQGLTLRLDRPLNNQNCKMFVEATLEQALTSYLENNKKQHLKLINDNQLRVGEGLELRPKKVSERPTKISWPSISEFKDLIIQTSSLEALAHDLKVSSTAIRKFCQRNKIDYKQLRTI